LLLPGPVDFFAWLRIPNFVHVKVNYLNAHSVLEVNRSILCAELPKISSISSSWQPKTSQQFSAQAEAFSEKNLSSDDHFDRPFLFMAVKGKQQNQKERNHNESADSV
jgi:hypothetical protein